MKSIFNKRQNRLIAICTILIVLNLTIWGIIHLLKTKRLQQYSSKLPTYGENLNERFQKASIIMEQTKARYGLLIFLGDILSGHLKLLMEEFHLIQKKEVDIIIVTKRDDDLIQQIHAVNDDGSLKIITDNSGEKHRVFGLSGQSGCLVFFQIKGAQAMAIYTPLDHVRSMQDALLKLSVHPILQQKSTLRIESQVSASSLWTKKVTNIPFDSLINNAEETIIDLDKLPQKKLQLERKIGHREIPQPGEPIFSRPWAIAAESNGRVFICDGKENQVFVLNQNGNLIHTLGRKGQGPGEFLSPIELTIWNNKLFVVDACLRVQKFDSNLQFLEYYRLDSEVPHFNGLGVIDNILFVPFYPLPPHRVKIINVYEMKTGSLDFITSFFNYFQPEKSYSNPMGAIMTFNRIRLTTDGRRYIAFGRTSESHFFLLNLEDRTAYKYLLVGKVVDDYLQKKRITNIPDFATLEIFKELAFNIQDHLYILVPNGIVVLNISSELELPYLCNFESFDEGNIDFGGYDHLAVSNNHIFLLSTFHAGVAIYKM